MTFPSGWTRSCALTINHTKVPATQSGFPALIAYNLTTDNATNLPTEMLTTGNTYAAQSNGADIRFSSDSAGASPLHCEIVQFVQDASTDANRKAEIWVNCAPSSSSDTTIYVWYANGSATAPAANDATFGSQGVWDSNYLGVYHFGTSSSLSLSDSTANANNMTNNGATATSGQFGGAAAFNGTSQSMNTSAAITPGGTSATVQFWQNITTANGNLMIEQSTNSNSNNNCMAMDNTNSGSFHITSSYNTWHITTQPTTGTWHQIACVYDTTQGTGAVMKWYADGAFPSNTQAASGNASSNTIGSYTTYVMSRGNGSFFTAGKLDELRFSKTLRSANWISTEYNNQSSPSTFWTVGTPSSPTTAVQNDSTMPVEFLASQVSNGNAPFEALAGQKRDLSQPLEDISGQVTISNAPDEITSNQVSNSNTPAEGLAGQVSNVSGALEFLAGVQENARVNIEILTSLISIQNDSGAPIEFLAGIQANSNMPDEAVTGVTKNVNDVIEFLSGFLSDSNLPDETLAGQLSNSNLPDEIIIRITVQNNSLLPLESLAALARINFSPIEWGGVIGTIGKCAVSDKLLYQSQIREFIQ